MVLKHSAKAKEVSARHSKRYGFEVVHTYRFALKGYAARLSPRITRAVKRRPSVLFVDGRDIAAELPPTPGLRKLRAAGQEQSEQVLPFGIDRIDAERSSARSGDGKGKVDVNVAVLDGGIQPSHPDLNVVGGVNCLEGRPKTAWADRDGHGTFVAGTVGALDNKIGVVGYAPGVRLFAVRVGNPEGVITNADYLCGVDSVAKTRLDGNPRNNIAVANMSLGGPVPPDDGRCGRVIGNAEHYAICGLTNSGVTSVVSAGNEESELTREGPATYREVLTVTAMGDRDGVPGGLGGQFSCLPEQLDDQFAFFSNWAVLPDDAKHTVTAPGVCVGSTWIGSQYAVGSGTSFSAPVVAATVALCIDSGPCAGRTPKAIVRKIAEDAARYNERHPNYGYEGDPLRPVDDRYYGFLIRAGLY